MSPESNSGRGCYSYQLSVKRKNTSPLIPLQRGTKRRECLLWWSERLAMFASVPAFSARSAIKVFSKGVWGEPFFWRRCRWRMKMQRNSVAAFLVRCGRLNGLPYKRLGNLLRKGFLKPSKPFSRDTSYRCGQLIFSIGSGIP